MKGGKLVVSRESGHHGDDEIRIVLLFQCKIKTKKNKCVWILQKHLYSNVISLQTVSLYAFSAYLQVVSSHRSIGQPELFIYPST